MFLEIKDIHKSFGENENRVEVLKGIDINVNQGEFVVMLGPSGSGKSTLLNIIGGIEESDEGSISIEGNSMNMMNEKKLSLYRRNHLGYIFQQYNLIPNLTVRENIEVGAYLSKHPLEIDPLIESLGLKEHQDKLPNQLSGGQQQRTSIGRAIIKNPDILLCDEPTGALDSKTSIQIMELIKEISKDTLVIMVTHNPLIADVADRVICMNSGKIISDKLNEVKKDVDELEWNL